MSTHHIDDTLDLAPIRARLRVTNATVENHIDINSCDEQAIMATLSDIHVLIAEVERLQSELATAKCTGASEELRRLADEWETRRHDRIYVWLLRKRADELEGIAQLDAGKQAEREQLKAQPFTPQNFIEKMMAMDTEERQAFVDSFNSIDMSGTWRCSSCGKVLTDLTEGSWRWNGKAWEHSHGQAGHFEGIKESSSEQADR